MRRTALRTVGILTAAAVVTALLSSATNSQQIDLTHAWADAVGLSRGSVDALPVKKRRRIAQKAAHQLVEGRSRAAWPADKAPITLRFRLMEDDGTYRVAEIRYNAGDRIADILGPAILRRLRDAVVFGDTIQVPSDPVTAASNQFVQRALRTEETVQAGTYTCVIVPDAGEPLVTQVLSVTRDRLSPACTTAPVWTEGPFNVPARDVAGRSQVKFIIAQALGEVS